MPTTTIVPAAKKAVQLTITLTSPLHHGAGSSGNTSLMRTQEVMQPGGGSVRVPFVSGASVRHHLRDVLAWRMADILGWEPESLSKAAVDLLWTGGAVTKTGAVTDLAMARRVEDAVPSLAAFGYAAQSDIITGTVRATDLILACAENAWRLPESLPAEVTARRAAHYRTDEFGTRHDVATTPVARLVQHADMLAGVKTTQMIWDMQLLKAGSMLHGALTLTPAATDAHDMILAAAVALWAPDGEAQIGAKGAQGYGRCRVDGIDPSWAAAGLAAWEAHVTAHADDITAVVQDLTA